MSSAMQVFRLYAYAINPQRTVKLADRTLPTGGAIPPDAELKAALDAALAKATGRLTQVALTVDPTPGIRTSEVRDAVMEVAFAGTTTVAERSAMNLAIRLAGSMDNRSDPGLLLVAGYRDGAATPRRRVALWVFPRGDGFRFASNGQSLQAVKDFFDQNSVQRKLAIFSGTNARTQFLQADVLDFQAGGEGEIADLWIRRFLEAGPSITTDGGTRMLAKTFREVSRTAMDSNDRQQLQAAVMALRQTPQAQWSIDQVAQQFLSGGLKDQFLAKAPNDASRRSQFQLDRNLFAKTLNIRIFRLESDVYVYSPIDEVGGTVVVQADGLDEGIERLSVEGVVVEDKLSQRRG